MYWNTYVNVVKVNFKIMTTYQTKDYMLLQIKEKKFIDKFKPKLNKTWIIHTHKCTQTYIDMYIYMHTQKLLVKNDYQYISNHTTT